MSFVLKSIFISWEASTISGNSYQHNGQAIPSQQPASFHKDYHALLYKLASSFMRSTVQEYDQVMEEALQAVGEKLAADRISLYAHDYYQKVFLKIYGWSPEGFAAGSENTVPVPFEKAREVLKLNQQNHLINMACSTAGGSPPGGVHCFKGKETLSLALSLMVARGENIGLIVLEKTASSSPLSESEAQLFKEVSAVIACSELQQKKEAELEQIIKNHLDLIDITSDWVWEVNAEGIFVYVNNRAKAVIGYETEEIIGRTPFDFIMPGNVEEIEQIFFDSVRSNKPISKLLNICIHKSGHVVYIETSGLPILDNRGRVSGFRGISRDITAHKKIEDALDESETKQGDVLATIEEGYYEVNLKGMIISFNRSTLSLTGYRYDELKGMYYKQLFEDCKAVLSAFRQVYKTGQPNSGLVQLLKCKNGRLCHCEFSIVPVKNREGAVVGFRGILRDITKKIEDQKQLKYLSMHDQLTGLYNRTFFEEELKRLRNSRDFPISIIYADVNGLKIVNDGFGHEKGDQILQAAAQVLRDSLRSPEALSRIGGDEFAAVLSNTDQGSGERIVSRIRKNIEEYNKSSHDLPLSISIGLATANTSDTSMEELFNIADEVMYRDKTFGSEKYCSLLLAKTITNYAGTGQPYADKPKLYINLSLAIGKAMGLDSELLFNLQLLAKAHNIGNAATPLKVLLKKEELTPEEKREIRMHPERGYRIALASQKFKGIAELILKHHERWDGSGYPLGLTGSNIPVECRILAVSDAFINMTNERVYKEALNCGDACRELENNAGAQFDPEVVKAVIALYKNDEIAER